jgi:hypothetical protein
MFLALTIFVIAVYSWFSICTLLTQGITPYADSLVKIASAFMLQINCVAFYLFFVFANQKNELSRILNYNDCNTKGFYSMSSVIRPLTLSERKKPAQSSYVGGFKNVSFQIGEIVRPDAASRNTNSVTPVYSKAIIRKSPTVQLPMMIPNALMVLPGVTNTMASVVGQKNNHGGFDAILVARSTERLSSFNSKLRTVEDLVRTSEEKVVEENRLGKSSGARTHNQVMLAGVVVGSRFEDGDHPKFHIDLRQDSNPNNIVPLIYDARNASAMVSRVKFGSLIYVDGEYAFRNVPIYQMNELGKVVLDENKAPVPVLDGDGKPQKRVHTYIRITPPKDPAEFDTNFGEAIPRWVSDIARDIAETRLRLSNRTPVATSVVAPKNLAANAVAAEVIGSMDDL